MALRESGKADGSGKIQADIPKEFGHKVEMLVLPMHDNIDSSILQLTHTF
ncbi:MAG: hypothetical protein PHO08_14940 [Methylococcales bacterium]|nr:hypothetical protein [Methylococcales bacterium]MDD5632157.1 hypothetical protein [Methylococcales bacterium]